MPTGDSPPVQTNYKDLLDKARENFKDEMLEQKYIKYLTASQKQTMLTLVDRAIVLGNQASAGEKKLSTEELKSLFSKLSSLEEQLNAIVNQNKYQSDLAHRAYLVLALVAAAALGFGPSVGLSFVGLTVIGWGVLTPFTCIFSAKMLEMYWTEVRSPAQQSRQEALSEFSMFSTKMKDTSPLLLRIAAGEDTGYLPNTDTSEIVDVDDKLRNITTCRLSFEQEGKQWGPTVIPILVEAKIPFLTQGNTILIPADSKEARNVVAQCYHAAQNAEITFTASAGEGNSAPGGHNIEGMPGACIFVVGQQQDNAANLIKSALDAIPPNTGPSP